MISLGPSFFLPSDDDPNSLLQTCGTANIELFSTAIGRNEDQLQTALETVVNEDPHDWFRELATALGTDEASVVRAAAGCLLSDADLGAEMSLLVEKLAEHLLD